MAPCRTAKLASIVVCVICCAVAAVAQTANDWPMYNHDVSGSRFNNVETRLTTDDVSRLHLLWAFPTGGDVYATPVVVGHTIYAGDASGTFYAISDSGRLIWARRVNPRLKAPITATALVFRDQVFVGDQAGYIYALDSRTGTVQWAVRPNKHKYAAVYGSPIPLGDDIVLGISSNEENAAEAPNSTYQCCTFRGSVVRITRANGAIVWQTYTIAEDDARRGSSGASIWSTPTYDATLNYIYVTTGNNYSPPATRTSDAMIALDADTGKFRWINQRTRGDITTVSNLEADFGDSPQVYALEDGRTVVSAGQKNGRFSVVQAGDSGDLIRAVSAFPNCGNFEGIFADSAVANGVVFLNGANCSYASNPPTGEVMAISGDGSKILWSFISPAEPVLSGVAVANGVLFFQASGLVSWLYAVEAKHGRVLARIPTLPAISGPSVAKGRVYMGTGVELASGIKTPTAILAFGLQ